MGIAEVFYGHQGEGKTIGQPRLFIRVNGCNLSCRYCDSKFALKKDSGRALEEKDVTYDKWCVSGGEPVLNQKEVEEYITIYSPSWVEVETNGTIIPDSFLLNNVDLWNISPKREADMIKKESTTPNILSIINEVESLEDYIVKFVVEDEADWDFVERIQERYEIEKERIWVMPKSFFNERDDSLRIEVYEESLKRQYNYSPRLHVMLFGNKKGV
jgi:organic radical activating enzyme